MADLTDDALWPLRALRVRTGDLELRYPSDDDLYALARIAADGVHAPDAMPFLAPWTVGDPVQVARSVLQWHWGLRARMTPEDFSLELAVVRDGELVGMQGVDGEQFRLRRTVGTGSWLGRPFQGRGTGTAMRLAVLHLAFDILGADAAESGAFETNPASIAVSRRLRYADNGVRTAVRGDGRAVLEHRFRMTRSDWERRPPFLRPDVTYEGIAGVRQFLAIDRPGSAQPSLASSSPEPADTLP